MTPEHLRMKLASITRQRQRIDSQFYRAVLAAHDEGGVSYAELARITGLSKTRMTQIVREQRDADRNKEPVSA